MGERKKHPIFGTGPSYAPEWPVFYRHSSIRSDGRLAPRFAVASDGWEGCMKRCKKEARNHSPFRLSSGEGVSCGLSARKSGCKGRSECLFLPNGALYRFSFATVRKRSECAGP